jgi:flagellar biogenesis protein FliO
VDLVQQSLSITAVFALLWLSLWWLKRKGLASLGIRLKSTGAPKDLELVERMALTAQHSVHVVRLRDRCLLVGVYPTGLSVLAEYPAPLQRESQ